MKRWQPINSVPLDTPVIVTDGRRRRTAILKSQKPIWEYEPEGQPTSQGAANILNQNYHFVPTHWVALPKLPESAA